MGHTNRFCSHSALDLGMYGKESWSMEMETLRTGTGSAPLGMACDFDDEKWFRNSRAAL